MNIGSYEGLPAWYTRFSSYARLLRDFLAARSASMGLDRPPTTRRITARAAALNGLLHLQHRLPDLGHHRRHEQHLPVRRAGQRPVHDLPTGTTIAGGATPSPPTPSSPPSTRSTRSTRCPWFPANTPARGTVRPRASTPGRRNFAFADGSVRFLKDSISTWPFNPASGYPTGVTDTNGFLILAPGTRYGVYQMLSTRNGGEVISADSY